MARTKRKTKASFPVSRENGNKIYLTAVYVRLSGEDERKIESESVDNQMELLKEFVEKEPTLALADSYVDRGVTGTKFDRPDFNRMMEDIRAGKIECVVVKDLSRLGRNYLEAGDYLEKIFPFFGVRFIAVTDNYDSLNSNVMENGLLVPLKNLINESYAKDISMKISAANESRFKQGIYSARHVAYGYRRDPEDASMLIPDEETKGVVLRIFKEYTSGKNLCEIARGLNSDNIPTPSKYRQSIQKTGKRDASNLWTGCTVKVILKNPVHMGDVLLGKMQQCYYRGIVKPVRRDGFYIENHHEAIVDRETFGKAQDMLESSRRRTTDKWGRYDVEAMKSPDVLKGFIFCGDCGRKMQITTSTRKRKNGKLVVYSRYMCYRSASYGDADREKSIAQEKMENIVFGLIKEHIRIYIDARDRVRASNRKQDAMGKRSSIEKRMRAAVARMDEIRELVKNLYENFSDSVLSEEEYLEMKASYIEEMDMLKEKNDGLRKQLETYSPDYAGSKEAETACLKYIGEEKLSREMVETFVQKIICYSRERFEVEYKYSDEIQDLIKICEERGGVA